MVDEIEDYPDEQAKDAAKLRTAIRHQNGWRPLHTDKNNDGTWTITWNNDPDLPDPNQSKIDRLEVLQQKVLDDTITQRELVEYERLKIQLGR